MSLDAGHQFWLGKAQGSPCSLVVVVSTFFLPARHSTAHTEPTLVTDVQPNGFSSCTTVNGDYNLPYHDCQTREEEERKSEVQHESWQHHRS